MDPVSVWNGSANLAELALSCDGVALSAAQMSSITRIRLTFGDQTVVSDNAAGDPIRWAGVGYRDGEIRLALGPVRIRPGYYEATLTVHHAGAPAGVVWTRVPVQVWPEPENDTAVFATAGRVVVSGHSVGVL